MISDEDKRSRDLTYRDIKFLLGSFIVITAATIISLYVYYNVIKKSQTQALSKNQSQNIGVYKMESKPSLKLGITTCEYDDIKNEWNPVLIHTFLGNSEDEIIGLIEAHKQTDIFFKASFEGVFNWKGGTIQLKNDISNLLMN